MRRYYRRGHWRRGRDGRRHWVSGHSVSRRRRRPRGRTPRLRRSVSVRPAPRPTGRLSDKPNARCPRCGARVWFFRDRRGGCAYFDTVGNPWTKHPCMITDASAAREAIASYAPRWRKPSKSRKPATPPDHAAATPQPATRVRTTDAHQLPEEATLPPAEPHQSVSRTEPLDWWVVFSATVAWSTSLPLSLWVRDVTADWAPDWVYHWLITVPTFLLLPALLVSLWRIPTPKITALDTVSAAFLSPLLLGSAIAANILTLGAAMPLVTAGLFYDLSKIQKRPETLEEPLHIA